MVRSYPVTLRMGDAIYARNLPAGLDAVGGYVDGYRADYDEVVAAFPAEKHMAIDAGHVDNEMSTPFDALDMERYAFTPADFPVFLGRWHRLNTLLPVGYGSAGITGGIVIAAGRPRSSYLLWTAHYTQIPHICTSASCAPSSPVAWTADGTQWTTHGGVWDESLLSDKFYGVPPTPLPHPPGGLVTNVTAPPVGAPVSVPGGGPGDYWILTADGGVFAFGHAPFYGSAYGAMSGATAIGLAATPSGKGYRVQDSHGGIYDYGDAVYSGRVQVS